MSPALRTINHAWNCTAVVSTKLGRWDHDSGDANPVHRLVIGGAKVALDLRSGVGFECPPDRVDPRRLTPSESRLVLLDWTRARMPVASPSALWAVEAASLAAIGSASHWRVWATTDLQDALLVLLNSPVEWTDAGRDILANTLAAVSIAPASVDSASVGAIVRELADFVASIRAYGVDSLPAPEAVSGCSEVEWDRVSGGIDLGELGLRSKILGTVWTASIAHVDSRLIRDPKRLWARLVDDASGAIRDVVEMGLVDGVWSARGYVPPSARKAAARVDVTSNEALPARTRDERVHALSEQKWFRMLHFARLSSLDSSSARWREVYRQRLCIDTPTWAGEWSRPFLAERHVRPTDLASGSQCLVSPDPRNSTLSAT